MDNPNLLSPSVLAFVGDAVYGLYVRTALAEINRPSGELHRLSVKLVNATAQAKAFSLLEPMLTEKELSVFKRGRNFHTSSTPKSATGGEYHTATGLECLFGFLYLSGNNDRADELFKTVWLNYIDNNNEVQK
ncbi:MAG: ribonuclease III [Ruminococcaceae bacterium]|jgi:ribonuclease-3 family protein|nr:ribonuclease III [Oscillospiraceae bacterium]MEE1074186.1 ribonuclease III domain-containing protein [Acutalibacteraceae bacterium]